MTLPFIRFIENSDKVHVAQQQADMYYNVVIGPRIQLHPLDKEKGGLQQLPLNREGWLKLLTAPLTWLIQHHPSLSAVVSDHLKANPAYLKMPSVDLSRVISYRAIRTTLEINKILEDEHNNPCDLGDHTLPLWRIVVVHVQDDSTFHLLFSFQHTMSDGAGIIALTEQLVERLNYEASTPSSPDLPTIVPSPAEDVPASMESRVDCTPGIRTWLREARAMFLPAFIKKALEKKSWAGEFPADPCNPHITQIGYLALTESETKQVMLAAKSRHTTVHSILFATILFATKAVFMSKVVDADNMVVEKDTLHFSTPISLRNVLSPAVGRFDLGNYVSDHVTRDVSVQLETQFWDLAKQIREEVVHRTQTPHGVRSLVEVMGLLNYLPKHDGGWAEFMRSFSVLEQNGRMHSLRCSNLGKGWDQTKTTTTEKAGEPVTTPVVFKVVDGLFSQGAATTTVCLCLNVATANNVMTVAMSWQKEAFTGRDRGELMLAEFKRVLLDATSPAKVGLNYNFCDALLHLSQEK
ncbi:hypothetical protein BGZ93_003196 [Podila epicladia]|nr:hypothetical protein BGZ92_003002 [Podila epicladia]KAG0079378.1 hypothetical protein BGZ93_003196 [Podila epicladia]